LQFRVMSLISEKVELNIMGKGCFSVLSWLQTCDPCFSYLLVTDYILSQYSTLKNIFHIE